MKKIPKLRVEIVLIVEELTLSRVKAVTALLKSHSFSTRHLKLQEQEMR